VSRVSLIVILVLAAGAAAQEKPQSSTPASTPAPAPAADGDAKANGRRTELNLMGKTDAAAGESRRNENVHFNPIDNNSLKELNVRLGATATIVTEFRPERGYFSAEFGNAPSAVLHVPKAPARPLHGMLFESHQNSVVSARSFFQVGDVKPAHDNNYGFAVALPLWKGATFTLDGSQQRLRGSVNGNVLVPRADERTPLATDPATRAIVARYLAAYPAELPNRTDINPRALNTNAPQTIDYSNASGKLDQALGSRDRLLLRHQFTGQHIEAFELVAGQNPNTDTRANSSRATWDRQWSAATSMQVSAGFDRIASLLVPEKNAVGPLVSISGLEALGPLSTIPIDRGVNLFRYAAQMRQKRGAHDWTAGFHLLRRQFNGVETDTHRGFFSFTNDFGRDAVTNLRMGTPTQTIQATGNHHRGFRNWDMQYYAGDNWKARANLTLHFGLRYQPVTRPVEVNNFNTIPYPCDCNNLAPFFGVAYRRGRSVFRAAASVQYGEIYPVTFQQVRFSPPWNKKVVVTAPSLVDPFVSLTQEGAAPAGRTNLYVLDSHLATPYEYQYNASWERKLAGDFNLQMGYVGSRGHKALTMWYLNRGHVVPGVPQTTATINERRPIDGYAEIRLVLNGSQGYYDAARIALVAPRWRGLSLDASYWFSKAMDLGSSYTNTAYEADSRLGRSQSEFYTHTDLKALSEFDQPHAFLLRAAYAWRGWTLSGVTLFKSGTPFNVITGSDAPGYGNVDGNGGDRPNIIDPSILGRTIGNPDTSSTLLPRSAFSFMKPTDLAGDLGRNTFRKGGIHNVNAALARSWTLGADKRLTVRAESINLFNTPQFAAPGAELANPNFGVITNTLNDGRTFRLMLQFGF
jgi:hypothetical protein